MSIDGIRSDRSERLAGHARQIATTGDRWFISLATSLSRVSSWVGRGSGGGPPARHEPAETTHRIDIVPATAATSLLHDEMAPGPRPPVDPDQSERSAHSHARVSTSARHPAGVRPLLEALRRVLSEHTETGGSDLHADERFWTLVNLLRSITRPDDAAAGVEREEVAGRGAGISPQSEERELDAAVIWKRKRKREPSGSPSGKDG